MKRKIVISFEVDSFLDDNDLHNVMDGAIELGLDRALEEKKIEDYEYSSKRVMVIRKGGEI